MYIYIFFSYFQTQHLICFLFLVITFPILAIRRENNHHRSFHVDENVLVKRCELKYCGKSLLDDVNKTWTIIFFYNAILFKMYKGFQSVSV